MGTCAEYGRIIIGIFQAGDVNHQKVPNKIFWDFDFSKNAGRFLWCQIKTGFSFGGGGTENNSQCLKCSQKLKIKKKNPIIITENPW